MFISGLRRIAVAAVVIMLSATAPRAGDDATAIEQAAQAMDGGFQRRPGRQVVRPVRARPDRQLSRPAGKDLRLAVRIAATGPERGTTRLPLRAGAERDHGLRRHGGGPADLAPDRDRQSDREGGDVIGPGHGRLPPPARRQVADHPLHRLRDGVRGAPFPSSAPPWVKTNHVKQTDRQFARKSRKHAPHRPGQTEMPKFASKMPRK